MLKEKTFNIGSVDINYAEGPGSGPPLLLLHGLPGRWQECMPVLPALTLQWHGHALDMRGQGKSGRVPGNYKGKHYTNDIVEFTRQKFTEPVIMFGFSAGGSVMLGAAAEVGDMVRGLILGDSPLHVETTVAWMTTEAFTSHFSALQEIAGDKDLSVRKIAAKIASIPVQVPGKDTPIRYGDTGIDPVKIQLQALTLRDMDPGVLEYHAYGRAVEFLEEFEPGRMFEQLTCPTLLLQADPSLGALMTDQAVELVKARSSNIEHVMLQSKGHNLGMDSWDTAQLLSVVVNFLDSLS